MMLQLLQAVIHGEYQDEPLFEDGTGGSVFHQVSALRYYFDPENFSLQLALQVLVQPPCRSDTFAGSLVTATMAETVIGEDELDWREAPAYAEPLASGTVFAWRQFIDLEPSGSGLIRLNLALVPSAGGDPVEVEGNIHCYVVAEDLRHLYESEKSGGSRKKRRA